MTAYSIIEGIFGACACSGSFDCQSTVDANAGIILWVLLTLYMFKALGTVCDEYFVPSLEMISEALQLSNDVAGATFMAAGSSAPELFTSLVATFLIVNEGGVGAIIGSAIFNILVIVGATCVFAGQELVIWWYPLARDCFFYSIAILELAVVLLDEEVRWYEGLVMFLSYVIYCVYMKFNRHVAALVVGEAKVDLEQGDDEPPEKAEKEAPSEKSAEEAAAAGAGTGGTAETSVVPSEPSHGGVKRQSTLQRLEAEGHQGGHVVRSMKELGRQKTLNDLEKKKEEEAKIEEEAQEAGEEGAAAEEEEGEEERTGIWRFLRDPLVVFWELVMPSPEKYWLLFGLSILNIAVCTYMMVDAVNRTGCNLGIGPLVMGLIFLAAGTSVPDALGSIAVAKQGEGDMAVANALGSNVFDIMLGLGVPWMLSAFMGNEVKFPGATKELLEWILVLAGILVLFIGSLVLNKWTLNKRMGVVLMSLYTVHVIVALVRAFA